MTPTPVTLKVLIVDDEPLAREGVKLLLAEEPDVSVIGECRNGAEAIDAIKELRPELVFLDIKMPRISGFEVIETIGPENMPPVIFLTAYDEHAIEAFTVHALDYLLKPISASRFKESLQRAREQIRYKSLSERGQQFRALLGLDGSVEDSGGGRLEVRSSGHVYFLRPAQIRWIEANGDYVVVHVEKRKHLIRDTMLRMEQRLSEYGFQRIHRSAIVNLEFVTELVSNDNGDYQVILTDGSELKLSRTYRDELYAALNA